MRICCLASGSSGNATYVETDDVKFLIDCGLSCKVLEQRLSDIGVSPQEISMIFVTHEHNDHIAGIDTFCKKYNVYVYVYYLSYHSLISKITTKINCMTFDKEQLTFGKTFVTAFELCHDSDACVGYNVICESGKMTICTDTGFISSEHFGLFKDSDVVIIESNHNESLVMNNPNYPIHLKRRILSNNGHLSNKQCAEYIECLCELGCYQFVLAHLSKENNSPRLAYTEIIEHLLTKDLVEGVHYFLDLAWQDKVGTCYRFQTNQEELIEF